MEKIRVLLADDHEFVRESMRQLIEKESDLEVVGEAEDGEQMVALAKKLKPDVIITDVAMPKLNGIEATREIKASNPSVSILVFTAYDFDQYVFALLDAGATGYLLKDISSRDLISSIYTIYKGDSVLHPTVASKIIKRLKKSSKGQDIPPSESLTDREMDVLKLAAQGKGNKEIASELSLSIRTIESHIRHIFDKLGVNSRTEAVIIAIKKGWVGLE
ncbi:MAG TPA: response regulator transcription factor [Anaerolineae bacterium]|nr:response regulator transcription factor [Anaerolineae bacterium]